MAPDPDDALWDRVQVALERYLLARGNGESLTLLAACDGDSALAERVHEVLGRGAEVLDGFADAPPAVAQRQFGDFELVRPLGRGGMGVVWLARQRSLGRMVAIKLLDRAAVEGPVVRLRLQREAELTALLDHPNIVPVYAVGDVDGVPFLAMKFLSGPSLDALPRPQAPERVARLGAALARALDAAHLQGIVHRDVKPANVLLDGETPVLVDFGLARGQSDPTLTQEGKVAGTLRYMAPERLDAQAPIADPRVDVYGLGATLYELLVDRPVFAEDSPTALVRSILTRDPPPLRLRGRHHDLETIVLRALAKEPGRRFPSAAAMAEDLDRYLAGQPVRSRRMPVWLRLLRRAQRHPRTTTAVAGLGLVAVVFAVVAWITVVGTRIDVARRFESAQADFAAGRFERAHSALQLLVQARPNDAAIAAAAANARAEVGFDQALMLVTDRSSNVTPAVLDEVRGLVGDDGRGAALALVLAIGHVDGTAAARTELQRQQRAAGARPLAVATTMGALEAWLDATPPPWVLPKFSGEPAPLASEYEPLVVALAQRLSAHPPETVRATLGATAMSRHARFLEAVTWADAGDLPRARGLLRGLATDDAPAPVWRWLAHVQLQLGDVAGAGRSLSRCPDDRSPSTTYYRYMQALAAPHLGDAERAELVETWRAAAADNGEVQRFLHEFDGKSDPALAAAALAGLELLERAAVWDPIGRDLIVAAMVEVAAWHLPTTDTQDRPGDPAAHAQFVQRWQERSATLRHRPAQAIAEGWVARSQCAAGAPHVLPGLERFARACQLAPLRVRIALDYAAAVLELPTDTDPTLRTAHVQQARKALATITDTANAGDLRLPIADLALVDYRAWLLAVHARDYFAVVELTPRVESILPDELRVLAREAEDHVRKVRASAGR